MNNISQQLLLSIACFLICYTIAAQVKESNTTILDKLSNQTFKNWDSLEHYANLALTSVEADDHKALSVIYHKLGLVQFEKYSDFDSARAYYDLSLKHAQILKDSSTIAVIYNGFGTIQKYKGEYDLALENFYESMNFRSGNSSKNGRVTTLNNIGEVLFTLGKTSEALTYHQQAFELAEETGNPFLVGNTNVYLGNLQTTQGNFKEAIRLYQSALANLREFDTSVAPILSNIGVNYFYLNDFEAAIKYYSESIEEAKKYGDQRATIMGLLNLAEAQGVLNKPETLATFDKAIESAKKGGFKNLLVDGYLFKSVYLEKIGQPKESLTAYKQYKVYQDSIFNERSTTHINELQVQYETAQKEAKISKQALTLEQQQSELTTQRTQSIILLLVLVVFVLFGIAYYIYIKGRQKSKLQLAIIGEKENTIRAVFEATERERQVISKNLHDGVGQQLSGIKMALSQFSEEIPSANQEARNKTTHLIKALSNATDEVRSISHQMMPKTLMELGLVPAISDLLDNTFAYLDIECSFEHHQADQRYHETMEISFFRITQELVQNILKHADATEVSVQLFKIGNRLTLTVEDDGKGIDPSLTTAGHGLNNIKSRLEVIKGTINYESAGSKGTIATVSAPLSS
ncbi:MAG: tetratricopeptide repeat protein [Marinoscillum sp.]